MSPVLIPPVLMLEILVKFLGFLSIGPPILPAVWKPAPEETLVSVIKRGHHLGHHNILDMVHSRVASHSSCNLSSLQLEGSLLTLLLVLRWYWVSLVLFQYFVLLGFLLSDCLSHKCFE